MAEKLQQDHFKVGIKKQEENAQYLQGRGAQINTKNRFLKNENTNEHIEGIDVPATAGEQENYLPTHYSEQEAKTIVNKVESPDVGMTYSMNPYAGCEHGCIYCYARNVHEYWGYSAGLDFESRIIVKKKCAKTAAKISYASKMGCQPHHAEREYRLLPAGRANLSAHKRITGSV
jgi:hypothetical protein